jgi:hypothetical protein
VSGSDSGVILGCMKPSIWVKFFAEDRYPEFRLRAARNVNTPVEILMILLQHRDPDVRRAAASNQSMLRAARAMWQLSGC